MFCTKCGTEIRDGFKFCPKCGTPAFVKKEKTESVIKAQVKEVKKETLSSKQNYIPNPLIAKELDIEGVKKMAEQGDKAAMLRQAFRYEMGIGVEKDVKKANELYSKTDRHDITSDLYSEGLNSITNYLCVTKKECEQYFNSLP